MRVTTYYNVRHGWSSEEEKVGADMQMSGWLYLGGYIRSITAYWLFVISCWMYSTCRILIFFAFFSAVRCTCRLWGCWSNQMVLSVFLALVFISQRIAFYLKMSFSFQTNSCSWCKCIEIWGWSRMLQWNTSIWDAGQTADTFSQ